MNHLKENDACPYCWHGLNSSVGPQGIGTYSIEELIMFEGGILNKHSTCNTCKWNFQFSCENCKEEQPCPQHYACGYDGVHNKHMPLVMHNLYMRNSPYKRSWNYRPGSIGEWYANQVSTYAEAISFLKRFTSNWKVQSELLILEKQITTNINCFWPGLKRISVFSFSSQKISVAVKSFYCVLWNNGNKTLNL
jgi:hypothetical protein